MQDKIRWAAGFIALLLVACGGDDGAGGAGGGGADAGLGGSAGSAAFGGNSGATTGGASGSGGTSGSGGLAGDAGVDASLGGTAGSSGTAGTSGSAGLGGFATGGASGSGGTGGTGGATGGTGGATGGSGGVGGTGGAGGGTGGVGGSGGATGGASGAGGTGGGAPMNTALPAVSGSAKVFDTLNSTNGSWLPTTGLTFTRAWLRCDAAGANCAVIPGATASTYLLEREDFGATLRVRVAADDGSTQVSADSPQTAVVGAPTCPSPITVGPLAAGTISEAPGGVAWSNPTQAAADDGLVASATAMLPAARTDQLLVKGFGFSVPAWAQHTGVQVDVKRSATGGAVRDVRVELVGPGKIIANLAKTTTWPATPGVASYGGPTTNYLNGWPATTINDPEFGVRIVAENTGTTLATANVDSVQITLFYTSGPALGPKSPTIISNDTTIGSLPWVNPGNAAVLDGVYADSPLLIGKSITYGLASMGFGFGLPAGKQPSGIYVEVTRKGSSSLASFIQDRGIRLMKGGVPAGTEFNTGDAWTSTVETKSFGGALSKFGNTLTAADVADPGFGFRFAAENVSTSVNGPASVDAVQMWVVYDAAATSSARFATTASATALGKSWQNLANAAVVDGASAGTAVSGASVSNSLRSGAHLFSVPTDAWVRGVALQLRRGTLSGAGIEDSRVNLRLAGTTLPANRAVAGVWPVALATANYGGATDLWGQGVVLPSDVNAASFGIEFASKYTQTAGNDWTYVDGVALEVTYCAHP